MRNGRGDIGRGGGDQLPYVLVLGVLPERAGGRERAGETRRRQLARSVARSRAASSRRALLSPLLRRRRRRRYDDETADGKDAHRSVGADRTIP